MASVPNLSSFQLGIVIAPIDIKYENHRYHRHCHWPEYCKFYIVHIASAPNLSSFQVRNPNWSWGWHQTPFLPLIWQRANVYVSVSPAFAGLNKLCKPFESTGSAQKQIYQMSLNNEYLSARVCCKGLVRETAVGKAKDNNKL